MADGEQEALPSAATVAAGAEGESEEEQAAKRRQQDVARVLQRAGPQTNWISFIGAQLQQVPPELHCANYPHLTQLYLGHNCISELPAALFDLLSLRGLFLQDNRLTRVSPSLSKLTDLQELNLANNKLQTLPACLFRLEALDCLWLDGNEALPWSLKRNISRDRTRTRRLVLDVCNFFDCSANCKRAVLYFIWACSASEPMTLLCDDLVIMIARIVWETRFDPEWGTRGAYEAYEMLE